jgi:SAM-dependent methyltransferase
MTDQKISFEPSHDERARQDFVGALKGYSNGIVQAALEEQIERRVVSPAKARSPKKELCRQDVEPRSRRLPLYAFWGNLTYHSQDLLFETVGDTVRRTKDAQEQLAQALTSRPDKLGSLELDPGLKVSPPVSTVEIHRQPGGYTRSAGDQDLDAARVYSGTIEIYRNAKSMGDGSTAGSDSIGQFTATTAKALFPDLAPRRVLDLGCGTGEQTVAFKRAFPDAEVYGLDAAGPLLRFAHAWAENEALPIHFRQANAQATGYPDNRFDLIVSHILFHETSRQIMPKIMREAHRILAPGGVFLNLDVPYQPEVTPLARQITNHWQVINNGEPFWTGFSESDLPPLIEKAGFAPDKVFHRYEAFGAGKYLVFGGVK